MLVARKPLHAGLLSSINRFDSYKVATVGCFEHDCPIITKVTDAFSDFYQVYPVSVKLAVNI